MKRFFQYCLSQGLLRVAVATVASVASMGVESAFAAGVTSSASFDAPTVGEAPPETGAPTDLDAPGWRSALHVVDFENFTTRSPAAERTEAYLAFTKNTVYCAFVVHQDGQSITATQKTNNVGLGLDDYVTLMFDTSGNGTNQYFFETTPLGVRYQQASESTRYAPPWTAFGRIDGKEWLAEIAVPFRFLRGTSRDWRVNFSRYIAATQQSYTWAYEPEMSSPFGQTFWPTIHNAPVIAARVPKPTVQVYGLASAGSDRHVFEGAAGQFTASENRIAGIDAKVPLTSGLNFDGTLNPDFSNVENDQQIISPQEFRYQYAEYRPFFTQGANDLPGSEVFYSPSIGVFDHGEKIEGQAGHFGIGLLNVGTFGASDRAFAFTYGAPNQEMSVSVSGAQADRLTGDDSVAEITASNTVHASQITYGAGSAFESDPAIATLPGASRSFAYLGVTKPNYSVQGAYYDIGPEYHPTDAFISENDIRGPQLNASLSSTTNATAPIRYLSLSGYADRYLNDSGAVHEADTGFTGYVTFKDLVTLSAGQSIGSLRSYGTSYPVYSDGVTSPYDQSTVTASFRTGTPNTEYASYSWGTYPTYFLQQTNAVVSRQLSARYSAEFDFGQVFERNYAGPSNGQILRRLSIFGSLSQDETLSLAYRQVSGTGGYTVPGSNLALSYFRRFGKGNTLQAEFGSPAASRTLDRYLIKYVILIGSGAGE